VPEIDVLVVGGINSDYVARGEALPAPGQTCTGETFLETLGGKGANQAIAAARLHARVALVGAIGNDERGPRLVAVLRDAGIVVRVSTRRDSATGAALIHLDRKSERQILAVLGANQRLEIRDVETACDAIGHARVVVAQLEVPLECALSAFQWARRVGAQTILDPAPAMPLADSVLTLVDVIRANASEAETLTGIRVENRETARRAAQQVLERGVGTVIVQGGDKGNLLLTRAGEHWLPLLQVETVDLTGAGDAFVGTLAASLARGRSMLEAVTLANAAAAVETTTLGAERPPVTEEQLRKLI
jgi:ribokinase